MDWSGLVYPGLAFDIQSLVFFFTILKVAVLEFGCRGLKILARLHEGDVSYVVWRQPFN